VVAISADTLEETSAHLAKMGWKFPVLSDPKAEAIRRYGLVHAGAGGGGKDIARPAEILIDSAGTVRWVELTEDYRVRARPEDVLEAFDGMEP
jgi:peroxiredoxin